MRTHPLLFTAVVFALVVSACSSGADETTTTSSTTTLATTTTGRPTTTAGTTTTDGARTVTVTGVGPAGLLEAVASLYSYLADDRNEPGDLRPGMVEHLATVEAEIPDEIAVTVGMANLPERNRVAVVVAGDDTLLAVEDIAGWRIVGGKIADGAAWLGDAPRMLLVLGSDARVGENQLRLRADSIHLLTLVPEQAEGAIVGFPRDSWVPGPNGNIKFSSLMAGRGPEIMLETTRELTGLPIEGYVVTGFQGFTGLIEILGNLEIDLPTTMRSGNNWDNFPAGEQTLGPTRALQLARIRKGLPGGDFARSRNQGLIMQAAMTQIRAMGAEMLPMLVLGLVENAWTDLSTEDLLTWAASVYFVEPQALENIVLPGRVATIRGASVVLLDEEETADIYSDLEDGVLEPTEES